jgi:transcriptional regulator with XRE-family HTH domain
MKIDFGSWLKNELNERRLRQAEFARMIGIESSQVSMIISGKRGTTPETLKAMSDALGIPIEVIYERAGLPTSPRQRSELIDTILHEIKNLASPDQEEVLAYIRMKKNLRKGG